MTSLCNPTETLQIHNNADITQDAVDGVTRLSDPTGAPQTHSNTVNPTETLHNLDNANITQDAVDEVTRLSDPTGVSQTHSNIDNSQSIDLYTPQQQATNVAGCSSNNTNQGQPHEEIQVLTEAVKELAAARSLISKLEYELKQERHSKQIQTDLIRTYQNGTTSQPTSGVPSTLHVNLPTTSASTTLTSMSTAPTIHSHPSTTTATDSMPTYGHPPTPSATSVTPTEPSALTIHSHPTPSATVSSTWTRTPPILASPRPHIPKSPSIPMPYPNISGYPHHQPYPPQQLPPYPQQHQQPYPPIPTSHPNTPVYSHQQVYPPQQQPLYPHQHQQPYPHQQFPSLTPNTHTLYSTPHTHPYHRFPTHILCHRTPT